MWRLQAQDKGDWGRGGVQRGLGVVVGDGDGGHQVQAACPVQPEGEQSGRRQRSDDLDMDQRRPAIPGGLSEYSVPKLEGLLNLSEERVHIHGNNLWRLILLRGQREGRRGHLSRRVGDGSVGRFHAPMPDSADSHADAYSYTYTDTDRDIHADAYPHTHAHSDRYSHPDPNCHADKNRNIYSNTDGHSDTDADSNSYTYTDTDRDIHACANAGQHADGYRCFSFTD